MPPVLEADDTPQAVSKMVTVLKETEVTVEVQRYPY